MADAATGAATAEQVASILEAAEQTAERLRERVNAERLLGDIQLIHARLRGEIDRVESEARRDGPDEPEAD